MDIFGEYQRLESAANFKKGDIVRITRKAMTEEGGWNNEWLLVMDKNVGKIGEVVRESNGEGFGIGVKVGGKTWSYPYFVLEKVSSNYNNEKQEVKMAIHDAYEMLESAAGFKKGDIVRITRKAESEELGWYNEWIDKMDKFVGKTGEVVCSPCGGYGIKVVVGNEEWEYPFFVLEKVSNNNKNEKQEALFDPNYRPDPFTKVLVRDNSNDTWEADLYIRYDEKREVYPFICVGSNWREVIPYDGNEHILGKVTD